MGGDGGVIVMMMAGLREELGVLLEDLQVLLFFWGCVLVIERLRDSTNTPHHEHDRIADAQLRGRAAI